MNKTLHFLSGVPRSGSTVLAAILNQNPATHVSTTSGLSTALDALATCWHASPILGKNDESREKLAQTMRGVIDAFYNDCNKSIVIDKSRSWPTSYVVDAMKTVLNRQPKIIATVRSIPDCAASFVRIAQPDDLSKFINTSGLIKHLKGSYLLLQDGYKAAPESFLFVEYEDLMVNPKKQLDRIHKFLGLPPFTYDFKNINGDSVKENDEELHGYAGMHDIKPVLGKQHNQEPKELLKEFYLDFCQPEFWLKKPRTVPTIQDLDLQLAASTMGDFSEGWRIAKKIEAEEPNNHRAAFNRGWYYLRQGQIQKGYQLMDRGRLANVFGNQAPSLPTPQWDGKSKGTVLLYLEGGLGDQIHQVRYAKYIAERGCKVVVSCTGALVKLFAKVGGVSAVVQHESMSGVFHDHWVAGMSAVVPLGFELDDLNGASYITKPVAIKGRKKRIGLRWQGNSTFEHEHHKKFPHELMFDAVKDVDCEFISLQRDEGSEFTPPWVNQVSLDSWEDTQNAVASCDLVISSCTSVSHLSAAMGVETWVITPIMPYFLYALDGDKTPYYDSMRLFRQEVFEDWSHPFSQIKKILGKKPMLKKVA